MIRIKKEQMFTDLFFVDHRHKSFHFSPLVDGISVNLKKS